MNPKKLKKGRDRAPHRKYTLKEFFQGHKTLCESAIAVYNPNHPFATKVKNIHVGLAHFYADDTRLPREMLQDLGKICLQPSCVDHENKIFFPYGIVAMMLLCELKISSRKVESIFAMYLKNKGRNAIMTILDQVNQNLTAERYIISEEKDKIWISMVGWPELPFGTILAMLDHVQALYGSDQEIVDKCQETKSVVLKYKPRTDEH